MILTKVYIFIGYFFVSNAQTNFMPKLPLGPFRLIINAIRHCENSKNLSIKVNIYLNKKSSMITEFKGNVTLETPIHDSLIFDANLASWSLSGGWIPNSNIYVTNNGCSNVKLLTGNAWYTFFKAFNVSNVICPIPIGNYSKLELDTRFLDDIKFPKVYFYGKYKFVVKAKTKENRLLRCMAYEVKAVRPWELPKN